MLVGKNLVSHNWLEPAVVLYPGDLEIGSSGYELLIASFVLRIVSGGIVPEIIIGRIRASV